MEAAMAETLDFPDLLRRWRQSRRMSQLDLALAAGSSTRHLSFLETGRARPSRDMVLNLCEALLAPRAASNEMLRAAGFAPLFPASPLDAASLGPFRAVLREMMERHSPWPAMLCDRHWNIREANTTAKLMLGALAGGTDGAGPAADAPINAVRLMVRAPAARTLILNWEEVVAELHARLRLEALEAGDDPVLQALMGEVERALPAGARAQPRRPVAPLELQFGEARLTFLSTIAHFGTSEDVTIRDLRLELMFPADESTRAAVRAMAG
jgi:transcriptional regulator with XRE-family HTH domain